LIFKVDETLTLAYIHVFGAFFQVATALIVVFSLGISYRFSERSLATASEVFTTTYDNTGFSNLGYTCLIGLLSAFYCFTGYEAAGHMSEETKNGI
jgi:amino acid transporter